jgi:hypothetical protein
MSFAIFLFLTEAIARCLDDVDDEVRDRAAMYLRVIDDSSLAETYVKEGSVSTHHPYGVY